MFGSEQRVLLRQGAVVREHPLARELGDLPRPTLRIPLTQLSLHRAAHA
jgi:hypothetical protein